MSESLNYSASAIGEIHQRPIPAAQISKSSQTAIAPQPSLQVKPLNEKQADKQSRTARLLIDATRDFGNVKRPSSEQIIQYKELFYQLIDRLQSSDRRMISAMLARLTFTPRAVALYFAQDDVEIAAPFLLFSSVLGDLDLRAIAKKKGKSYAEVISKRQRPIDAHTQATLKSILESDAGDESAPTKPAVNITVPTPKSNEEKWLDGNEIVALASVGGRLGKKSTNSPVQNASKEFKTNKEASLPKQETRRLLAFARVQDRNAIASYVEELCDLETSATLRLLETNTGEELVYLVKALGIPSPHNMQFLLMVMPRIGRDIDTYRKIKSLLGELEINICRMIFNEIGAKFEIAGMPQRNTPAETNASTDSGQSFQQAARRRRDEFDQAPNQTVAPRRSRFSFEQSFMATG